GTMPARVASSARPSKYQGAVPACGRSGEWSKVVRSWDSLGWARTGTDALVSTHLLFYGAARVLWAYFGPQVRVILSTCRGRPSRILITSASKRCFAKRLTLI